MSALRSGASAYRRLFRARVVAFSGDRVALRESRLALRLEFVKNKDVGDAAALVDLFKGVDEVEEMLRSGILQGKVVKDELTDTTKVEVKIRKDQSAKMDKKDINKIEHLGDAGPAKGEKGLDDVVVCKSSSQSTAKK